MAPEVRRLVSFSTVTSQVILSVHQERVVYCNNINIELLDLFHNDCHFY